MEEKYIELEYEWAHLNNTGRGGAVFSLKRRKFVRPYIWGRATTYFRYKLLPGMYVELIWGWWNKMKPSHRIYARLIKLYFENGRARKEVLREATFIVDADYEFKNEILRDFFMARPGYHAPPKFNFEKVYEEKEVKELIELIEKNYEFIEGLEHE
ncbi:MAG: hypothetical protein QW182_04490 [Thermosphaera sp.]